MFAFLLRRLLMALPVVWIVVTLVFGLIHMVPGDPVALMLGEGASVAEVEGLRPELGLDRPLLDQYRTYMKVIVSVPFGVISAVHHGRAADRAISFVSLFGVSLPNFVLGPLLILFFSIMLGLLPVSGRDGFSHLVLPAVTLGGGLAALMTRMVRGSMLEEIRQDYVRTARAKGLAERAILFGHALRNGLLPVITLLGLNAGALLAGAFVTEPIFSWPGLGRLTIQAINARDYPLVQGCILTIALTYILINLATDVLYSAVDPRIRYD